MDHELKTWPELFEHIRHGLKTCEVRKDDRGFKPGDMLLLREYHPAMQRYSGRELHKCILHILKDHPGLVPGYVVLSLS